MNAIGEQISAILWNVFNRPRLVDLIDILLLTIIIYELLVHVRQTRVSQTIKGIIILLIATWLSDVLGMRTIHALLAWMINAGPVLLIVLFQSEIRRKNSFRRVGATRSPRYGERLTTDSDAHLAARRKAAPQRCAISDEPKEVGHPTK